jgi:GT2 family glycosyltransferase
MASTAGASPEVRFGPPYWPSRWLYPEKLRIVNQIDGSQCRLPDLHDVEVILVNYRSRHHVAELLASWPEHLAVTIVDNSHNCDGVRELAAARKSVRYVDGGGQGYARAANRGAHSATARFLVFVNPDSRPTADQLSALVGGLRLDPSAVAHAGIPMGPGGRPQIGAGGWEPSVRRSLVYSAGLQRLFPQAGLFARPNIGEPLSVDWAGGTCMAVRREQFLALYGFDEAFYVYSEDVSFGRRGRQQGLRSVLRTDIIVPHSAGSSGAPPREMLRLRGASFAQYVERYHCPVEAAVMRGILTVGALFRGTLQFFRGDPAAAQLNLAYATGAITGRAYVGGVEVARSRAIESADPAALGAGRLG